MIIPSFEISDKKIRMERTLVKLNAFFEAGQFYEAEQLYRTMFSRYNTQKKFTEAIDLMYNGAMQFLAHKQANCGMDMAQLLIQTFENAETPISSKYTDMVVSVFKSFQFQENTSDNASEFMKLAIKWSTREFPLGSPALNLEFALYFWKNKEVLLI